MAVILLKVILARDYNLKAVAGQPLPTDRPSFGRKQKFRDEASVII